jgi:hypothetical protein
MDKKTEQMIARLAKKNREASQAEQEMMQNETALKKTGNKVLLEKKRLEEDLERQRFFNEMRRREF